MTSAEARKLLNNKMMKRLNSANIKANKYITI